MDAPTATPQYSDELHELAANAGRALTASADDVQVVYVNALRPGALPEEWLTNIDGVLMLGGADVDPTLFTSDPAVIAGAEATNRSADEFEIALVQHAERAGLPVLGICRGAQVINVAYGGTLITDLGEGTMHRGENGDEWRNHDVTLADGSRLAQIYARSTVDIRSAHHQAVDTVAAGFTVAATAADGVVEGIEASDDRWIVAVQWHPEDTYANIDHLNLLTRAFVAEARNVYQQRLHA